VAHRLLPEGLLSIDRSRTVESGARQEGRPGDGWNRRSLVLPTIKSLSLGLVLLVGFQSAADGAPVRRWRGYWKIALANAYANAEAGGDAAGPINWGALSVPEAPAPLVLSPVAAPSPTLPAATSQAQTWNVGTITEPVASVPVVAPTPAVAEPAVNLASVSTPAYDPLARWTNTSQLGSSSVVAPTYNYDAFINLGDSPYAGADQLTAGGARPWYESNVAQTVYGGTPTADQRASFTSEVLEKVEHTFSQSGVPVSLTTDPSNSAAHMLSVVANTTNPGTPGAAGITTLGGDGFSFIDNLSYASTPEELADAVAGNVAHELMHAFNVGHYDSTGNFLDAASTSWDTLINPSTVFSPEAASALLSQNLKARYDSVGSLGAQMLHPANCTCGMHQPQAVPEPTTMLVWSAAATGLFLARRRLARRPA
jgi:hypothetical protein